MRLFIAADLDEGARAAVAAAVGEFRDRSERERPGSAREVSWVKPAQLHVTLHFLGEIDDARLPSLSQALAPPLDIDPPRIGLAGWGVFPARGPARVIWIGLTEGAATLASAHGVLGERLRSAGITLEARPFSPHLTVGRVKVPSGPHWSRLAAGVPAAPVCGWAPDACVLYQSRLSPAGATHQSLVGIPFIGRLRRDPAGSAEVHHAS